MFDISSHSIAVAFDVDKYDDRRLELAGSENLVQTLLPLIFT
jgi:hypothetical protein